MSINGISALERGTRTPQHETLALLAGALALDEEQREEFEAAAARRGCRADWVAPRSQSAPGRHDKFQSTVGAKELRRRERRKSTRNRRSCAAIALSHSPALVVCGRRRPRYTLDEH